MIDLEIVEIEDCVYHLMEEKGRIYELNLRFLDIDINLQIRRSYIDEF